jgi:hypothetical protein
MTPEKKEAAQRMIEAVRLEINRLLGSEKYGPGFEARRCRSRTFSRPRQILAYLMREDLAMGPVEISGLLGGVHPTSVIHGHKVIGCQLEEDVSLGALIVRIRDRYRRLDDPARAARPERAWVAIDPGDIFNRWRRAMYRVRARGKPSGEGAAQ